ncbi:MAG TPA: guanylate kinase [Nitrospirales bacterium]|jgi:guanylate kinase|nr:guanylate kinase [Nitrospirales bacterium]HIO22080.1 guanylate kinase [Nitrospirales bacterium]
MSNIPTNEDAIAISRRRGLLFVISGPSGAGKTSLCTQLVSRLPRLRFSISYTTRPQRSGEIDGQDYAFVSKDAFQKMIGDDEFLEWAEVYGHSYGTHRTTISQSLDEGIDLLLDIDEQGARQLKKTFQEGVFIYLLPPSLDALRTRLQTRGLDSQESIQMRLERARDEMQHFREYTYITVNNDLNQSLKELEAVITAERMKTTYVSETCLGGQRHAQGKE